MPCFGGSAGAIIFGATIETCMHLDENLVGLEDLSGLNLCNGRAVWCHYSEKDEARVASLVASADLEVISLPEGSCVCVDSQDLRAFGEGEPRVHSRAGTQAVVRWNGAA
jgi:dipeptidase E